MKRYLFIFLLFASFAVGVGGAAWPAFVAVKDAVSVAGRSPGEYPGDHDCPPGQRSIEVVTRFSEVVGGSNVSGTRTALYCEDSAGVRTNVSQEVMNDEVSSILNTVLIGVGISIVGWVAFTVLSMMGAKAMVRDILGRSVARAGSTPSVRYATVRSSDGTQTLDPATANR